LIVVNLFVSRHSPTQTALMALVNAIVNSPDDLEFRMHLRNELFLMGMDGVTDVRRPMWWPLTRALPGINIIVDDRVGCVHQMLRQVADVDLDTQLNVFEDEALADEEALSDQLNIPAIDMEYPLCMPKPLWRRRPGTNSRNDGFP